MEWIIRALKPNGKAFIVVPDGIFNRQNDKNLREFIRQECHIDGIISLPLNTFFTTNKKTYILCLTKKNGQADIQTDPVFTYLVSEIGESRDIYRFDIEQNDLNEATTLYNFFKGNKADFESFNQDPRCKIFPITKFEADAYWTIDRWWNKEEKIALGIENEDKAVSFEEVPMIIEEVADTLTGISAMIKELSEKKKFDLAQNVKEVKIEDIFELPSIKGVTKEFIENNKGQIPVYGGKIYEEPVGYIANDLPNIKYFENCLAWNRNGSTGYVFFHKHKFSTTDDHRPMFLRKHYQNTISLEYTRYAIENILLQKFSWGDKAGKEKVAKIAIEIPTLPNGDFDINTQEHIIEKHNLINDLKSKVAEYKQTIKNLKVKIDEGLQNFKEIKIKDIFDVKKGNGKYTRTYGQQHTGEYPVYSGSNIAPIMFIDTHDYDGEYLSWVVDGFAGYMKVLTGKFSATGHKGIMISKDSNIDLYYVKFILEPLLRELAKGRKGDNGASEYTNVAPSVVENSIIEIPILLSGDFDIETQKAITKKYLLIEQIKTSIEKELTKIEKLMVDF